MSLVFAFFAFVAFVPFVAFVASGATFGSVAVSAATSGSVAGSGVGWSFVTSSKFFIGINLLLKLSRIYSLALNNSPKLFKKDFFSSAFISF